MPDSGIIGLAVGLVIVFGATAALTATATEAVVRLCGLRGAFLLRGLYELLDGGQTSTVLGPVEQSYLQVTGLITGKRAATAARAAADAEPDNKQLQDAALAAEAAQAKLAQASDSSIALVPDARSVGPSATSALLGSPILRSRGMAGQGAELRPPREPGRLPDLISWWLPPRETYGLPPELIRPERVLPQQVRSVSRLWRQWRRLPPYIPAESFAGAVMDLLMPDATEEITMATVRQNVNALPDEMTTFKPSLQALVKNAANDVSVFRASVARWFDHQMDHVSREYKRHITKIVLVAGTIFVVLFNINAIGIGLYLYSDFPVDSAVISAATNNTSCSEVALRDCMIHVRDELSSVSQLGLPVAWATVPDCTEIGARCNWYDREGIFSRHGNSFGQVVLLLIGWGLTVLALLPGARFWFGLLSRLKDTLV
jgi:hypothetical protein